MRFLSKLYAWIIELADLSCERHEREVAQFEEWVFQGDPSKEKRKRAN